MQVKKAPIAHTEIGAWRILLGMGYDTLLLSGGEATLHSQFRGIVIKAKQYWPHVGVITANPDALDGRYNELPLDDIMYSPHTDDLRCVPRVFARQPVYAMVMWEEMIANSPYHYDMFDMWAYELRHYGYSGMTVCETYPDGEEITILMPTYANFSVRYKSKDACLEGNLLTPDFKLIDGGQFHV